MTSSTTDTATATATATAPVTRESLHVRSIDLQGFRRSDGLFEIEGRLLDRKPHPFASPGGRSVAPHEPIHDMGVRIVYDLDMGVHEIETFTHGAPYERCLAGGEALQSLKGLHMAGGWNREVRERLSGARSCTHLKEILGPMATAAIQTLGYLRVNAPDWVDENGRPRQIDSCYAYAAEGEVVLRRWPQFHRPAVTKE